MNAKIQTEEEIDDDAPLFSRGISHKEVIYTANQLAIMVETGITLSTALASLAEQEPNLELKRVLNDLKRGVEEGEDFSVALARHPRYFDRTFIALVRSSEQTGALGEMLERIAAYLRNDLETRGKVKAALAYPGVMMGVAIAVTIFLLTYVMPKFMPIFKGKGIKLPTPTVILIAMSESMLTYWYLWLIGLVASVVAFLYFRATPFGKQTLDLVKINLPILGPMFRKMVLSRSIRTLATMIQSGVTVLEALKLTSEVAGNHYFEKAWLHVVDEVTQGKKICDSLRGNELFPPTLVQMISSGEDTGQLAEVLLKVSAYYDRELELSIKTTTSLIEPIMIVVMGFIVGGIAMSLLLPIFQLSKPTKH